MQPRILIVYTGGTIGMTEDLSTGALVPFSFDHLMKNVPKIGRLGFNLDHVEMDPPIDSSNMNPACWARIASVIADRYEDFDGFVVLHGTDTMAYTASVIPGYRNTTDTASSMASAAASVPPVAGRASRRSRKTMCRSMSAKGG